MAQGSRVTGAASWPGDQAQQSHLQTQLINAKDQRESSSTHFLFNNRWNNFLPVVRADSDTSHCRYYALTPR